MWSVPHPAIKHRAVPPVVGKRRLMLRPADVASGEANVSQEPVVEPAHAAHGTV